MSARRWNSKYTPSIALSSGHDPAPTNEPLNPLHVWSVVLPRRRTLPACWDDERRSSVNELDKIMTNMHPANSPCVLVMPRHRPSMEGHLLIVFSPGMERVDLWGQREARDNERQSR